MPRENTSTHRSSGVPSRAAPRSGRRDRRAAVPGVAALLLAACAAAPAFAAPRFVSFTPPGVPPSLAPPVNPNVLIVLDTSQSMDATMGGKLIAGNNPGTRGNVARSVLREVLDSQRYKFNWSLASFDVLPSGVDQPVLTFAYYLGTASTMVYTNVCTNIVDGVGVSDKSGLRAVVKQGVKTDEFGLLPCILNPEHDASGHGLNGFDFITFSRSGDDADVNDVLYADRLIDYFYGIGVRDTDYIRLRKQGTGPNGWTKADGTGGWVLDGTETCFSGGRPCRATTVGATDSGWLPTAPDYPRMLWVRRTFGFDQAVSGRGIINEPVVAAQGDAAAQDEHFKRLGLLLASETDSPTTPELKNAAQLTPLAGSLKTAADYFGGNYTRAATSYPSPIAQMCQRNYVVLATDGNPTARIPATDGTAAQSYAKSETVNSRDPVTGRYTFGQAALDVFSRIDALRSLSYGGSTYDVQTYLVGLGDTVANPGSVAALNEMARRGGTGTAFLASDSDALKRSLQSIVSSIGTKEAANSAVALSSRSFKAGALLFQAKFDPTGWTGELLALPVGGDGSLGDTPAWRASSRLMRQDWNTGRQILTLNTTSRSGIPFRWPADPDNPLASEFDREQIEALRRDETGAPDNALGALRAAYLRGDTSHEARRGGTGTTFRNRLADPTGAAVPNILGDIIDSAPLYVAGPSADHAAGLETASYPAFAATWANRTPLVYVGANDGMLHAFDAATGDEKFAYVPGTLHALGLSGDSPLALLTKSSYNHEMSTVDGSPVVGDAFYDGAWHSLLVSGLRYGGKGLFALDVTNPAALTESNAAAVVRWEFADAGMGYLHAKPLIVKTNDGKWSVLVANGYQSSQGTARLYVLDAGSGVPTTVLDTGAGSAFDANGLAGVTAVDLDSNGTVDVAYAGDVYGNLWKFDLRAATAADWKITLDSGQPLFAAGRGKPITGAPDVTRHPEGGLLVTFGTGRYLLPEDVQTAGTQTLYGIWDRDDTTVTTAMLQSQQILDATARGANGDTYRFSTHRVGPPTDSPLAEDDVDRITRSAYFGGKRGWYIDLPAAGERVAYDAAIRGGRAVFSSLVPSTDPCSPGGIGWVIEVDVLTGNRRDSATFDTNGDRRTTSADFLALNAGTNNTSGWQIGSLATQVAAMSFPGSSASFEQRFVQDAKANLRSKAGPGRPGERQRVMWRVVE